MRTRLLYYICLICALLVGLSLTAIRCSAQDVENGYTDLAAYLTNRQWVKEFEIDLSKNRYAPIQADAPLEIKQSPLYRGFTTMTGSLQPEGFFFRCVSNSAFPSRLAFGESTKDYWQVHLNQEVPSELEIVPKSREEGGPDDNAKNGKQIVVQAYKRKMIDTLNFGIKGLDNSHITWVSDRQFTSPLLDWTGRPTLGNVHVTVESTDHGMPQRLRAVSLNGQEKIETLILCRYDSYSLPPREMVVQETQNGKAVDALTNLTNIVKNIVFGLRDDAVAGFDATNFLEREQISRIRVVMTSNGVRYVQTAGNWRAIDEAGAIAAMAENAKKIGALEHPKRANSFRVFLWLLILPIALVLYKGIRWSRR